MAGGNAAAQLGAKLTSKIDEAISYLLSDFNTAWNWV
jgi:hypothetical protein